MTIEIDTRAINALIDALNNLLHIEGKERYCQDDLLNVDNAMKHLGLGNNRARFYNLIRRHNIKQVTLNNQKIGFRKSDIEGITI